MGISLAGFLEEGKGFEDLEKEAFQLVCELGRKMILDVLEGLDLALSQRREPGLQMVGKRSRTLITRFGDVTFERRLYRYEGTGRYRFLLDEVLGLPIKEAVSKGVTNLALKVAGVLPYCRPVGVLEKFLP